jgi:twitching motility two-component system response regulator PilH
MAGSMFQRIFNKKKPTDAHGQGRRKQRRVIPRHGTRILIVDDSTTVRFVMARMLRESGYQVLQADNGTAGLEMASRHQPDLIFMDVIMPGLNGFQVTRKLRQSRETKDLPIIIISGNKQVVEQFWATRIGANDYMEKPFDRRELFYRLEKVLYHQKVA